MKKLTKNQAGHVLFGIGIIGIMFFGSCLDCDSWAIALLGILGSILTAYAGYRMTDLTKAVKWESRKTRDQKELNREETFRNWMRSTEVVCMKADIWRCHNE